MNAQPSITAKIVTVKDSLVTIELDKIPLMKNELGFIVKGGERLKSEVLRIHRNTADLQVFEDTSGVSVGDIVEFSGEMLSVELGPGLLGRVFDGLQSPLDTLAQEHGFFLPRGVDIPPLDRSTKWDFTPTVSAGDKVTAGSPVGTVQEGPILHKVLVPFQETPEVEITQISRGMHTIDAVIGRYRTSTGEEKELRMARRWPVRRPLAEKLLRTGLAERQYPSQPLITTMRIVDTFFPIARGGTACIPGPFGSGKTVLQTLIARYADVDVVVIVACGERAGEVVETITEFPLLDDPRTGGALMDRTVIICNTSSMPVAARESSLYMGISISEYYRQMGYHVLVIADSTSRWAQALRETSGRMEEIPGEEAFPAYLDSSIKSLYERAGVLRCPDGSVGSLTMIGTVSPAGGNFEEPVTQATLGTVKTFLGLSSARAYRRFFPAIDPLQSWSRYRNQLKDWYAEHINKEWTGWIEALDELLNRGDEIHRMMQVTGEEGISMEDYVTWQKALLLDMVYLQQDAYDDVDVSTPIDRQVESFTIVKGIVDTRYDFTERDDVREFFTRLTGICKNMNYCPLDSGEYKEYRTTLAGLLEQHSRKL